MDVNSLVKGLVRGSTDVFRSLMVGPRGDMKQSKFLPDYASLVAEGKVWRSQEASATASVTALPTTTGLYTIGNNEPDDGLWYVIIAATAFNSANAAALDTFGLAAVVSQLPATTGGTSAALAQDLAKTTVKNMLGVRGGGYSGRAILDTGVSVVDDDWFPLCNSSGSTAIASATGATLWHWLHGIIILPPKALISIVSTATSTSCTTRKGFVWAEVPRDVLIGAQ